MATRTLGTKLTTSLTAISFGEAVSDADFATIMQAILDDYYMGGGIAPTPPASPRIMPGAFSRSGVLIVPNRGVLRAMPGDYIGVDATGWPILLGSNAISSASTSWSHS